MRVRPALGVIVAGCGLLAGGVSPQAAHGAALERTEAGSRACLGPCALSVSVVGSGAGTVTGEAVGIHCRTACWAPVEPEWVITLTALPDPGSWLSSWRGCDRTSSTTCTITIPLSNALVVAVFDVVGAPPTQPPAPPASPPAPSAPSPPASAPASCTLIGTEGDDVLNGSPGNDVICGLGGNDHIHAGGGDDVVYGGSGDDEIELGAGNDRGYGGTGNDVIEGESGDDVLDGGPGRDRVLGGTGNDRITGGAGRDTLLGGPGRDNLRAKDGLVDHVHGGPGRDTARVDKRDKVSAVERRLL